MSVVQQILQFDIGNTRLKWRKVNERNELLARGESFADCLDQCIAAPRFWAEVGALQISNVGKDALSNELVELCREHAPSADIYLAESENMPRKLKLAYDDVSQMGVDRCLVLLAALQINERAAEKRGAIVIDAGSAITADYLESSGRHLGGYIMCGLQMMASSLGRNTSRIGLHDQALGKGGLGVSTETCVSEGSVLMFQAAIDRLIQQALARGDRVLLTGGDSERVMSEHDSSLVILCPDLVFDGLFSIASEAVR